MDPAVTSRAENETKMTKSKADKLEERFRKTRIKSNIFEGISEVDLYHGLKLASSTPMIGRFDEICYCSETQEYLVLDVGSMVHRYSMQGKPIRPPYTLGSTMLFTRMLWCSVARALACHIPHDDMIWIINTSCKLIQIVRNEFRIEELFYSPMTNEIIVVGTNKIAVYGLQDIEHPLNCLQTLTYLDSSYGSIWTIENSSLIEQSSVLAMAGSYLTNIYIMSLKTETMVEGSSQFLAKSLGATKAAITALYYHKMSQWIITGDQQGNVAGWNLSLEATMSCPNGHDGQILSISRHPSICGFLTISTDNILQVWSCNLRDKIESFRDIGEIWRIAINDKATSLASLGTKLNCFHMNQLYVFYAPLTAPATNLRATTNPTIPMRVIVASSDNTVRILSSRTGRQINVQILSPSLQVVAASYSEITNRLYTIILKTGEILVSSVKTKPMKLKHVWVSDERAITCIVAYETFEKILPIEEAEEPRINPLSTLIIAGTLDGKLLMIEESTGRHVDVFPAHDAPIIDLSSSTISRQLVSVGQEKCVKVWRIFPDIASSLVLMSSVYYILPITRVASLGFTACMISSTPRTKYHRISMYNTTERIKLDHHQAKGHSALITSIAALESLEICASSSLDKTIRIWNEHNELLKILRINTALLNITFSSLRGDIVFGAGKHLYRIPHENYLSPEYRARLIVEKIPLESDDVIIAENNEYRIYDEEVDREKALRPVGSTPFGSLDTENSEAPRLELMLLEQMTLNLRYREEDILRIKEGTIKATRLVGNKSIMSQEAWQKQMMELLDSPKIIEKYDLPVHDIFNNTENYLTLEKVHNEPEIFRMIYGHSIPSPDNYTDELRETVKFVKLPGSGFIPNSLIYKIPEVELVERQSEPVVEKQKFKYRYPPEILFGYTPGSSEENFVLPITLSQLAYLDTGEEDIFDE